MLPEEDKAVTLIVTVQHVATINVGEIARFLRGEPDVPLAYECIQAMDIVLKHKIGFDSVVNPRVLTLSRSVLFYPEMDQSIGCGTQVWLGYKQAIRPCQTGLALTLDTATAAVWDVGQPERPRRLTELMAEVVQPQGSRLERWQVHNLNKSLRGLKIRPVHNNFKRTILRFTDNSPFQERVSGLS